MCLAYCKHIPCCSGCTNNMETAPTHFDKLDPDFRRCWASSTRCRLVTIISPLTASNSTSAESHTTIVDPTSSNLRTH